MRCPRLPAVSIGKAKSKVNKYGVGMPGAILREGLGRAPAVTRTASVPATRARADSSAGLKYKAASDSVCKSQVLRGHGDTGRPRFCSSKDWRPGSARLRDSNRAAVALGTIGAGRYRCTAQPANKKTPEREAIPFRIAFIELFAIQGSKKCSPQKNQSCRKSSAPRRPRRAPA